MSNFLTKYARYFWFRVLLNLPQLQGHFCLGLSHRHCSLLTKAAHQLCSLHCLWFGSSLLGSFGIEPEFCFGFGIEPELCYTKNMEAVLFFSTWTLKWELSRVWASIYLSLRSQYLDCLTSGVEIIIRRVKYWCTLDWPCSFTSWIILLRESYLAEAFWPSEWQQAQRAHSILLLPRCAL